MIIKIFQILFKKYSEQRVGQVPICAKGGLYIYTFMIVQVWHINIPGVIPQNLVIISFLWRETGMGDMLFILHSTLFVLLESF